MTLPPLVHAGQIEQAALATLQKWIWTYIGFAEQRFGYATETLPNIRGWAVTGTVDLEKWPEDQYPCLVLVSPGLADAPHRRDEGYDAAWAIDAAILTSTTDETTARNLSRVYASAIRECLTQQAWEGGLVNDVHWVGERYDDTGSPKQRTIAAARLSFHVIVDAVSAFQPAPTTPEPLPDPEGDGGRPTYPDLPTAEDIRIVTDQLAQEG